MKNVIIAIFRITIGFLFAASLTVPLYIVVQDISKDQEKAQKEMEEKRLNENINTTLDELTLEIARNKCHEQQLVDIRHTLSSNEYSINDTELPTNPEEFDKIYLKLKVQEYTNDRYSGAYKSNEIIINDASSYNANNRTESIYLSKKAWKISGTLKIFKIIKTYKGIEIYYGKIEKPVYIEKDGNQTLSDLAKDFGQYSGAYDGKTTVNIPFEKIYPPN